MNARHLGGWSWSPTLSASFPIQLLSAGSPYSDFFKIWKRQFQAHCTDQLLVDFNVDNLQNASDGKVTRLRWGRLTTNVSNCRDKKSSKIGSIQDIRWQGWARRRQHMSGCMQVIWKEDRNGQSKCGLLSWSWSENIRLAGQSRPARKEHLTYTRWSGPYNRSRPKHHNS